MYRDRKAAGEALADRLEKLSLVHPTLLAIPRGGVAVAAPIARRLHVPIQVLVTRKIGHPHNDEVAIGAVMPDGAAVLDNALIAAHGIDQAYIKHATERAHAEIERRLKTYTGTAAPPAVSGRTAVIVDDGIATGYTIRAAIRWLKSLGPVRLVIAVPVAPPDIVCELGELVDDFICPLQPEDFMAVGMYYEDFAQTTDAEVMALLAASK
ncbi:phosphoribosyltransferase [Sporolituus thermophilus]|uniref:Predicted phosphoribosyltransferase n=1 Tax=Sporolituus thermophilus DSM 23256 TaxID=1123285 RepID=A0A1G7KYP7_9FIRM|nr:phosphoribosyltransferase family protein [Sporolituus thermophilus]SDF42392.1 Predicted phosphoribosyltransferase [Sporolituus thermophilus DSM 23256]